MRAYLEFGKKAFLRSAAYRFEVWSRMFSNLMFLLMWASIWTALYAGRESAAGATYRETLTYIALTQGLSAMYGAATPLWEMQEKVRTGDVAMELMRPFDVPLRFLSSDLGNVLFYTLTAVIPLYTLLFWVGGAQLPSSAATWGYFALSVILGFLVRWAIETTFGLLTFFLIETGGVEDVFYFAMSLLSGSQIPLWFFPQWLLRVAEYLPFRAIYYVPGAVFLGRITLTELPFELGLQVFWAGVTMIVLRLVWLFASRRVVVQGG